MQPYQQRVIAEKADLDQKLDRLSLFLATPAFTAIDEAEQARLRRQADAMLAYSSVLGERIAAFKA